jgi:hypothetical protein
LITKQRRNQGGLFSGLQIEIMSYFIPIKFDKLVKNRNSAKFVIPAKAGIKLFQDVLNPGIRRGDDPRDFLRPYQHLVNQKKKTKNFP